jgi:hypothetical protein
MFKNKHSNIQMNIILVFHFKDFLRFYQKAPAYYYSTSNKIIQHEIIF